MNDKNSLTQPNGTANATLYLRLNIEESILQGKEIRSRKNHYNALRVGKGKNRKSRGVP